MVTKVLSCPGALNSYNELNFGGILFQSPNTYIDQPLSGGWNNVFGINNSGATGDMNKLYDSMLFHYPTCDYMVVCGHSRGAQIIYKMFRERKADIVANFDPNKIHFISSGNPETPITGGCYTNYDVKTPAYPGTQPYGNGYGISANATDPFKLLNIVRQYDEWADTPPSQYLTVPAVEAALNNNYHSNYQLCPTIGIDGWPVDWDDWGGRYDVGQATFLVSPEPSYVAAPTASPRTLIHGGKAARNRVLQTQYLDQQSSQRRAIEAYYVRGAVVGARVT